MSTYSLQARTIGRGKYVEGALLGPKKWKSDERPGEVSIVRSAFRREVETSAAGEPRPTGYTSKFDVYLLLSSPAGSDMTSGLWLAFEEAHRASWERGASGLVIHYLCPKIGGPQSPADLERVDVKRVAEDLYNTVRLPSAGVLLLCPTTQTAAGHTAYGASIEALTVRVLNELQEQFLDAAAALFEEWEALPPESREERFVPPLAPPLGVIEDRQARLVGLHACPDLQFPRSFSVLAAHRWLARADPHGLGSGIPTDAL